MAPDPPERMDLDSAMSSDRDGSASDDGSEPEAPMVVSRARRSNAGNRMSTLLAQSAAEEEWGDEWEEAADEEDFVGDEANNQDDYNLDSSSSEEDDDADDDDDAGEKELRKAERQDHIKKRKPATNPFAARLAAPRKKVKLDIPQAEEPALTPRPKKKSERASWIPTEEDGPTRTSSRRQTVENKEHTLAKLKEKDKRRDDTLAMMKAAEARKAKDEPKPMSQAERLTEALRVERVNSKSLHRWEEAEVQRAAERQAKIDALKNRHIEGPFIRYYSGPAIYVDDKLKYTGKDAPKLEDLEEKLNKDIPTSQSETTQSGVAAHNVDVKEECPEQHCSTSLEQSQAVETSPKQLHQPQSQESHASHMQPVLGANNDPFMGSHGMSYPSSIMFAPPQNPDSFLFGIDQYATPSESQNQTGPQRESAQTTQLHPPDLPPNPFSQSASETVPGHLSQGTFSQSLNDSIFSSSGPNSQDILSQFQKPPPPPAPPRRKVIRRALRNLLVLSSFPNLEAPVPLRRSTASLVKDKDRSALIQLSTALFGWSHSDATGFVTAMLSAPKSTRAKEKEAALNRRKEMCPVSNSIARYRDPETGIAYRDARAFGVLRGVVGGGFVWSGDLGCYVGGRAKPLEIPGGNKSKGFLGMAPAQGVPKRFMEMPKPTPPSPPPPSATETSGAAEKADSPVPTSTDTAQRSPNGDVVMSDTVKADAVSTT